MEEWRSVGSVECSKEKSLVRVSKQVRQGKVPGTEQSLSCRAKLGDTLMAWSVSVQLRSSHSSGKETHNDGKLLADRGDHRQHVGSGIDA